MSDVATESEPVVRLTESAIGLVRVLRESDQANAGKPLRVYVESGGCSGLQYGLVFDEKRENDLVVEASGVQVLIDAFSANYLRGAVVDFLDALNGGGFKISNPNARQSCGCGKSFEA